MKFKLTGTKELKASINKLSSKENMEKVFSDNICKRVPEASAYKHKFKFKWAGTEMSLDEKCVPSELMTKIVKAFE